MAAFTVDEVVVITGASSGIGAGTAVKFVERGATRFCLTGRQLDALNETKAACIAASSGKLTDDKFNIVVGLYSWNARKRMLSNPILYKMEIVNRVSAFQNYQNFLTLLPKDQSQQVKIASL